MKGGQNGTGRDNNTCTHIHTLKELAKRMGISAKGVRLILRSSNLRDIKNKSWHITPEQAKQVIKDYKAEVKEREAKKQAEIGKQLKGEE